MGDDIERGVVVFFYWSCPFWTASSYCFLRGWAFPSILSPDPSHNKRTGVIWMLMKSCARCGCLIPYGKTYCSTCEPIVEERREELKRERAKKYTREYNATRSKKFQQFYRSKEWITLARLFMQRHQYKCEDCGRLATEVHHIKPIQTEAGWDRRLDETNLAALCTSCHNGRHQRFKKKTKDKK